MDRKEFDALRAQLSALPGAQARQMLRFYQKFVLDGVGDCIEEDRS